MFIKLFKNKWINVLLIIVVTVNIIKKQIIHYNEL